MAFVDKGIRGVDLSFYQGNPNDNLFVDFEQMKHYGNAFVIIKAGQRNYADPAFGYNWRAAKQAKLLRGAYWFLDDEKDGKSQADFFWTLVKDDLPEGPLVVDYEWGSGTDWRRVYDFLFRLQELSKFPSHKIWIYTGYYYWRDYGPLFDHQREWFKQFMLWLAAYLPKEELARVARGEQANGDGVLIPAPWTEMTLWQIGTPVLGKQMGAHSFEIDYNVFNGGVAEFSRYFDMNAGDPVPPGNGGNMNYKVIWPAGASERLVPSTNNAAISVFPVNTVLDVVEDHISDLNDPFNPNKKWVKLVNNHYVASDYPDSSGTPRARLELIVPPPIPEQRAYSFKVQGYKEVSGNLEPE